MNRHSFIISVMIFSFIQFLPGGYTWSAQPTEAHQGLSSTQPTDTTRTRHKSPKQHLDHSGRTELLVFTGIYTVLGGGMLMGLPPISNSGLAQALSPLGLILATTGSIAAAAIGTSSRSMTTEQVRLIEYSTLLGMWNSGLTHLFLTSNRMIEENEYFAVTSMLGGYLGYGVGWALGRYLPLRKGSVTFGGTAGILSTAFSGMLFGALSNGGVSVSSGVVSATLFLTANLGFVAGIFIHPLLDFSAKRTLLIGAAGAAGLLLGTIPMVRSFRTPKDRIWVLGSMAITSLLGMGLTIYATRGMKTASEETKSLAVGSLVQYNSSHWRLGIPLPNIRPQKAPQHTYSLRISVPIASGSW